MAKVVYFDLETTGLEHTCDIIQIGAVTSSSGTTFSTFVRPNKPMSESAMEVTGLRYDVGKKVLIRTSNNECIQTQNRKEAFFDFIQFLRKNIGDGVILVAHNGLQFDAPVLLRNLEKENLLLEFRQVVSLFSDTFQEIKRRNHLPRSVSRSLENLVKYYNISHAYGSSKAHDALGDSLAIRELVKKIAPGYTGVDWFRIGKPVDYFFLQNGAIHFPKLERYYYDPSLSAMDVEVDYYVDVDDYNEIHGLDF